MYIISDILLLNNDETFKFRPQIWNNHELYTIEEDKEGYQRIKRDKVTWKY